MNNNRLSHIAVMTESRTPQGEQLFRGKLGGADLVMFRAKNDKWKLAVKSPGCERCKAERERNNANETEPPHECHPRDEAEGKIAQPSGAIAHD